MKIIELDWIMKNRNKLNEADYQSLLSYDVFNQYDNHGELHQNAMKMLELIDLIIKMHEKYNIVHQTVSNDDAPIDITIV